MRTLTSVANKRTLTAYADSRNYTAYADKREWTSFAHKRDLSWEAGAWYTQDDQSWTTWGQTNIQVFWPGYTKTFGDLP